MARWDEVRAHVSANYEVESDRGDGLTVAVNFSDGTSQKVVVSDRGEIHGRQWAGLFTVVALEAQVNIRDVLLVSGDLSVGGLGLLPNGMVVLSHSVPMSNLDEAEIAELMLLIAELGDHIEHQLTGRDVF
jgi:hypothetical protein